MFLEESFEAVQRVVSNICCPTCSQYELEFVLRCDLGYEECLRVVRCNSCRHSLVLSGQYEKEIRELIEHDNPSTRVG